MLDHEFPEGFKPVNIEAYDGSTDLGVWIEDFILHIHMARGDDLHAIKYLPLKLKGPARHWLKSLPENSIGSWEELEDAFRANFQGTYVQPPDADDLSHIIQQPGESARKLWNRFLTKKCRLSGRRSFQTQRPRRMARQTPRSRKTGNSGSPNKPYDAILRGRGQLVGP